MSKSVTKEVVESASDKQTVRSDQKAQDFSDKKSQKEEETTKKATSPKEKEDPWSGYQVVEGTLRNDRIEILQKALKTIKPGSKIQDQNDTIINAFTKKKDNGVNVITGDHFVASLLHLEKECIVVMKNNTRTTVFFTNSPSQ